VVNLTYFANRLERLIDWAELDPVTGAGMYVNRNRALTRGVELGAAARLAGTWQVRLGYTYLEAFDRDTGRRLSRRPRHSFDASTWLELSEAWTLGLGVHSVSDRVDIFAAAEDYTVVRLFATWRVTDRLSIKARIENLFDEEYEEVYGYRSLPRGLYGTLEWKF
jgi:vitamin B12 transporter